MRATPQMVGLYVEDEANRAALVRANPAAYRNVVGRLLEGAGRGLWADPPAGMLDRLRDEYGSMDAVLEGVAGERAGAK